MRRCHRCRAECTKTFCSSACYLKHVLTEVLCVRCGYGANDCFCGITDEDDDALRAEGASAQQLLGVHQ